MPWNLRLIEDSRQAVPIFPEEIINEKDGSLILKA